MRERKVVLPARVERFWCTRAGAYTLDDDGFLRDPDANWFGTQSANPGVLRIDELGGHRCLVLLGEPGAGKSTAVGATDRLVGAGVPVLPFDLAAYGSEERLVREVFDDPSIIAWSAGSGQLCLVLDSLDEARARVPHVGAVVADRVRRLPYDRLFVRIACRTADWPTSLEQSLEKLFGAVAVVEILPLRQVDVSAIAAAWCDPPRFLDEVAQASAGPLAARPLTLRFLARSFGKSGALPERGAGLYAAGSDHSARSRIPPASTQASAAPSRSISASRSPVALPRRPYSAAHPRFGPAPRSTPTARTSSSSVSLGRPNRLRTGRSMSPSTRYGRRRGQACSPAAADSVSAGHTQPSPTSSLPTGSSPTTCPRRKRGRCSSDQTAGAGRRPAWLRRGRSHSHRSDSSSSPWRTRRRSRARWNSQATPCAPP